MRIVSHCQDRALLLLQIAQECPQFEEQATYLAHEWLVIAAMQVALGQVVRPNGLPAPIGKVFNIEQV